MPSLFSLCSSPNAPVFWNLSLTPISISYGSAPLAPRGGVTYIKACTPYEIFLKCFSHVTVRRVSKTWKSHTPKKGIKLHKTQTWKENRIIARDEKRKEIMLDLILCDFFAQEMQYRDSFCNNNLMTCSQLVYCFFLWTCWHCIMICLQSYKMKRFTENMTDLYRIKVCIFKFLKSQLRYQATYGTQQIL